MKRALSERWSQGLAVLIESVRVNAVALDASTRPVLWLKRRRFGMGVVIAGGNVFLRLSHSCIRMFVSAARWRAWEVASFRLLHPGRVAEERGGGVVALEALPGESLDRLLARGALTSAAVEAAARELRRAHALVLPGASRPWSHGDAHLKNFLYEAASGRAWLIDFETRHDAELSAAECHADDLLVFLLDLGGRAPEPLAQSLARAFLQSYDRDAVRHALLARLRPPRGLERALWKSRSGRLPEEGLRVWLEHLRRVVLGVFMAQP